MIGDLAQSVLQSVSDRAREAGVFESVRQDGQALRCAAMHVESEAEYRIWSDLATKQAWIGLFTPDRWLSESIEAELLHVGDKLEDLIEEELVDQGLDARLVVEHFRDEQKQYVFRSPVPSDQAADTDPQAAADRLIRVLLAYEAAFRPLGDMAPPDDDAL